MKHIFKILSFSFKVASLIFPFIFLLKMSPCHGQSASKIDKLISALEAKNCEQALEISKGIVFVNQHAVNSNVPNFLRGYIDWDREILPIYIAYSGCDRVLKYLMDRGATFSLDMLDKDLKYTALMVAAKLGHTEIARILLDHGAEVDTDNGSTALLLASEAGQLEVAQILIDRGAQIDKIASLEDNKLRIVSGQGSKRYVYFYSPLVAASGAGHVGMVKLLLTKGANINGFNNKASQKQKDTFSTDFKFSNITPLMAASSSGQVEVVKVLLENGAQINIQTDDGVTALMAASASGYIDIVQMLLDKGADINISSKYGITPIMVSSCYGHYEVVKFLVEKGANINLTGHDKYTALNVASIAGHNDIVQLLLNNGAIDSDLQIQAKFGIQTIEGSLEFKNNTYVADKNLKVKGQIVLEVTLEGKKDLFPTDIIDSEMKNDKLFFLCENGESFYVYTNDNSAHPFIPSSLAKVEPAELKKLTNNYRINKTESLVWYIWKLQNNNKE